MPDNYIPGESFPKQAEIDPAGEAKAAAWADTMGDAQFQGGQGEQIQSQEKLTSDVARGEKIVAYNDTLYEASKVLNYGFDTASKEYGVSATVERIKHVDPNSNTPVADAYNLIEPSEMSRARLFTKIQDDDKHDKDFSYGVNVANHDEDSVVFAPEGRIMEAPVEEKTFDIEEEIFGAEEDLFQPENEESRLAIEKVKEVSNMIDTDEAFAAAREAAMNNGMDTITYLVRDAETPSLSYLFGKVQNILSDQAISAEEQITQDAKLAGVAVENIQEDIEDDGEFENFNKTLEALNELIDFNTNPEIRKILKDACEQIAKYGAGHPNEVGGEVGEKRSDDAVESLRQLLRKLKRVELGAA